MHMNDRTPVGAPEAHDGEPAVFHSRAAGSSLAIALSVAGGLPVFRHFGADLGADADLAAWETVQAQMRWGARPDTPVPLRLLPLAGDGSFARPALVLADGRQPTLRLGDVSHGPDRLTLTLVAEGLTVTLSYCHDAETGVLAARARAESKTPIAALAALTLPLPARVAEARVFGGDWANEMRIEPVPLGAAAVLSESSRGRPGHDRMPLLVAAEAGVGPDTGEAWAILLGWSGGHVLRLERLRDGTACLQGAAVLDLPATRVETPVAYALWSGAGTNGLFARANCHALRHILRPRPAPRPVHLNTWEAVYFRHDRAELEALAEMAAAIGVERFVLDDGWFKGRRDDRAGLGDWTPDPVKYPEGLGPLIAAVRARGLDFGLWVEPEMVNPDSDLARSQPGWLMRRSDGAPLLMRHQHVLEVARPEVAAHLFAALDALLRAHPIAYLKWDMNRDLTEPAADGAAGAERHTRALYALLARVRAAHPAVEIETCASGGGRADWGILGLTDRVWASDTNDALDRLRIDRWTALAVPLAALGVHVGPERGHITGRRLGLDLRAHVALFGHFGLELDLRELDADARARLAAHIAAYKTHRALIHGGRYLHLETHEADHLADAVAAPDGAEMLVRVVRTGSQALGRALSLRLPMCDPARRYRIRPLRPLSRSVAESLSPGLAEGGVAVSGALLRAAGLTLALPRPETSLVLHLTAEAAPR